MTIRHEAAESYIRHIRNPGKRAYADCYWRYLKRAICTKDPLGAPDWKESNIGFMAAQAVRMRLREFCGEFAP